MKKIRDRFSGHSSLYEKYRPLYPTSLYKTILNYSPGRQQCWDCATGNGQVARVLSHSFKKVHATDISENQLAQAPGIKNITYSTVRAEKTTFKDDSFDLITVAQAIHWFDIPAFLEEARRVSKPEGTLAAWGYGLLNFGEDSDLLIRDFYENIVGPYWDRERLQIDEKYESIPFNLKDVVDLGNHRIEKQMNLLDLRGYLTSWSSVQNYMKVHNKNPVDTLMGQLEAHWQEGTSKKAVFPLFGKLGQIIK